MGITFRPNRRRNPALQRKPTRNRTSKPPKPKLLPELKHINDAAPHGLALHKAAEFYHNLGWSLIPVRGKIHTLPMPEHGLGRYTLPVLKRELKPGRGLAVLLGEANNWLTDVDLDFLEAVEVAPYFLPPTGLISGRPQKPKSHWFYRCRRKHGSLMFVTEGTPFRPDGHIVEYRSSWHTCLPPSPHVAGGKYSWDSWGEPATVDPTSLRKAVGRVAIAAYFRTQGWSLNDSIEIARRCDSEELKKYESPKAPPLRRWGKA